MSAPRLSVLMPVYNAEAYLAQAVESVLGQTYTDFEFIIVDDGSRDSSPARLAEYAARDARVVVVGNASNQGLTRSLNTALARARGALIARQDADDLSLPERFERQVAFLDAQPRVGMLATAIRVIDGAGGTRHERYFDEWLDDAALQQQLLRAFCIAHGSVMMRRAALERAGGYRPVMEPAEDQDLWLRLGEVTQLACLPEPLYHYRVHAASVSRTRNSEQTVRLAQVIESALRRRHGPQPTTEALRLAGRAHLKAALVAAAAEDLDGARQRLVQARALCPDLLDNDEPLAELLANMTAPWPAPEGLALYRLVFDELLPRTRGLDRLHARLQSRLHMREVFAGARLDEPQRVDAHLWAGVRTDPNWLRNRGVLALMARWLRRHWRRPVA